MRAVVQRVSRAAVREVTSGEILGSIGAGSEGSDAPGLCVLLGIGHGDTQAEADWLADKITGLRIFPDDAAEPAASAAPTASRAGESADAPPAPDESVAKRAGNMNRSLREVGGALLVVSQFTLYADLSRGRRPSFTAAMPPTAAEALYEYFVAALRRLGYRVATGRFGALMAVELINQGPVTLWLDTCEASRGRDKTPSLAAGQGG
jgi:D-tyrosyl-tRNA(Tyr) deacylase